ncbi:hypothetical protein J7643_04565 [bacterium]|nr:hypothetical protein [bacterium]
MRVRWGLLITMLAAAGCAPGAVSPVARAPQAIAPRFALYQANLALDLQTERTVQALPAPAAWDTVVVTVNSPRLKAPLVSPVFTSAASLSVGFTVPVGSASIEATLFQGGATGSLIASGSTTLALLAGPNVATISVMPEGSTVGTLAGTGTPGFSPEGTAAASAQLNRPTDVAVDASGNVIFVEEGNHRVRMIPKVPGTYFGQAMLAGRVYTVAGTGAVGLAGDNGPATSAQLNAPSGLALDASGNLYIADTNNNKIRRVDSAGIITTSVGNGIAGGSADGMNAATAQIKGPTGVAVDASGNLFVADTQNHLVCMVPAAAGNYFGKTMTAQYLYKIAGTGTMGFNGDGAYGTSSQLNAPTALRVDDMGNLIIADTGNNRVRILAAAAGNRFTLSLAAFYLYTITGGGASSADFIPAMSAKLESPAGIALDAAGNLLVADSLNHRIRKVVPGGQISTLAGGLAAGFGNGLLMNAKFNSPRGLVLTPSGEVLIADRDNHRLRLLRAGMGGL